MTYCDSPLMYVNEYGSELFFLYRSAFFKRYSGYRMIEVLVYIHIYIRFHTRELFVLFFLFFNEHGCKSIVDLSTYVSDLVFLSLGPINKKGGGIRG